MNYDISANIADIDIGDRTALTYNVTTNGFGDIPFDWLTFSTVTEAFTGTPDVVNGPYTIEVRVTDLSGI